MKERIRATALTAALALFLLAACGAQEAVDEGITAFDDIEDGVDSEGVDADRIDISGIPSIEQPLPDDYEVPDFNLIIIDPADADAMGDYGMTDGEAGETAAGDGSMGDGITDVPAVIGEISTADTYDPSDTATDWFASTGKSITPTGSFTLVTTATSDDFTTDIEEVIVDCIIDITTVPSDTPDYHTVIATLMLDCEEGLVWEMVPFDRYTGSAMMIHRLGNGSDICTGTVTIDGQPYDVSYNVDIGRGSDGRASSVYRVSVPDGYDGLIFYVAYANAEIAAEDDTLLKETVTLSDMASWGGPSEYFFTP